MREKNGEDESRTRRKGTEKWEGESASAATVKPRTVVKQQREEG